MRVGISMFIGLYCVWQIKSSEISVPATKEATEEKADKEKGSSGWDKAFLYPPPLVSPYGGTIKLLMGIAVPIAMSGGRILVFGQNFQFQYPMPENATFFTNYLDNSEGKSRRRRTVTTSRQYSCRNITNKSDNARSMFYRSLELAFERWGANGKDCMLRSICEAAETPLRDEGLVGELLHSILTPDYGDHRVAPESSENDHHLRAAQVGRSGQNCSAIYPSCPKGFGLLDKISRIVYN